MKRLAVTCLGAAASLILALGCSDDDTEVGPGNGGATSAGGQAGQGGIAGAGATGGGSAGGGGQGGGCHALPGPPLVTAVVGGDGSARALYPVTDGGGVDGVIYDKVGNLVSAKAADGTELWSVDAGEGSLFGGFDYDADGWIDVGVVHGQQTGQLCGTTMMRNTWLSFVRGKTGVVSTPISPLADICWTFGSVTYPTSQWSAVGVLFGPPDSTIATLP